jgi:colicin import membrane protein
MQESVYRGLVVSLALHLAVVAWGLISIPHLTLSEAPPIEVTLVTSTEFARLSQDKPAKDDPKGNALLQPETPKKGAPLAPEPLDAGGNKVTALLDLEPVPREPLEEQKALQQSLGAHEELKNKQTFDPGSIGTISTGSDDKDGALLVSSPDSQQRVGGREGGDTLITARELAALVSAITAQLKRCWKEGDRRNEAARVTLRWRLNPDGSLDGEPQVAWRKLGLDFEIAADAIRAVKQCQPFKLDQGKYQAWRTIVWDFFDADQLR